MALEPESAADARATAPTASAPAAAIAGPATATTVAVATNPTIPKAASALLVCAGRRSAGASSAFRLRFSLSGSRSGDSATGESLLTSDEGQLLLNRD